MARTVPRVLPVPVVHLARHVPLVLTGSAERTASQDYPAPLVLLVRLVSPVSRVRRARKVTPVLPVRKAPQA